MFLYNRLNVCNNKSFFLYFSRCEHHDTMVTGIAQYYGSVDGTRSTHIETIA